MSLLAVADAGPIIHLGEIGSLELLSVLDRLVVPETVFREVEAGGTPSQLDALEFDVVRSDTDAVDATKLDPGETAALAIALERDGVLLTDDLAAREHASDRGVEVHGSIGVIALASAEGRLDRDAAASRMRTLQRETSLFVTDAVVERGIRLLDDS